MGHPRDRHCKLAKLNNAGKCVAPCTYNQRHLYRMDCTGHKGATDHTDKGREVPINGTRP